MAIIIQARIDILNVPDGAAGTIVGQNQANFAGFGSTLGPGSVGASNSLRLIVAESVPGGDSPSQANFNTAIGNMATDLETLLGTTGAWGGNGSQTPLAIIQGWSTGGGEIGM